MLNGILEGIAPALSSKGRIMRANLSGSVALNNTSVFFNLVACFPRQPGMHLCIGQANLQDTVAGTFTDMQAQIVDGFAPTTQPSSLRFDAPPSLVVPITLVGLSLGTGVLAGFPYGAIILQGNDATGAGGFAIGNSTGGFNTTQLTCVRVGQSQRITGTTYG